MALAASLPAAEPMDARSAARTIDVLASLEEPLRRRAEGIVFVVWGLCTTGFLTSLQTSWHVGVAPSSLPANVLLVVWLGVAAAVNLAVLRLAGVAARQGPRWGQGALVAGLGVLVGLFVLGAILERIVGNSPVLVIIGLCAPWGVAAALRPQRMTSTGRRVLAAIAAAFVVSAVALSFAFPHDEPRAWTLMFAWLSVLGGLFPLIGGLWQALRG